MPESGRRPLAHESVPQADNMRIFNGMPKQLQARSPVRLLRTSTVHKASANVFKRISEKWSLRILATLQMTPMHFLALQRSQTGVSKKVLCETLRHLERDGLVTRRPEIHQSAVEYSLTAVGQRLCTALVALHQWAEENATAVEESRQRFDAAYGAAHPDRSGSDRAPSLHSLSNSSHSEITETTHLGPRSHRRSADGQVPSLRGEAVRAAHSVGAQSVINSHRS